MLSVIKRSITALVVGSLLAGLCGAMNVHAATIDEAQTVRVGLTTISSDTLSIANTSLHLGYSVNDSFVSSGTVYSNSGFEVRANYQAYIKINNEYSTYEEALMAVGTYSIANTYAVPCLTDSGNWAVYIGGDFASEVEASASATGIENYSLVSPSTKRMTLYAGSQRAAIFEGSAFYPQLAAANADYTTINGKSYRGVLEFGRYESGAVSVVNVLDLNEYLWSVTPSEMPASWHIEALKAQAVTARTYALNQINTHSNHSYYDLCDTQDCQVYNGVSYENLQSTQAVEQTDGMALYYNGQLIEALYFSSSGGATDDSEHAWGNAVPYLRSVDEAYETEYKQWSATFTLDELTSLLNSKGANIGNVTSVAITGTTSTGWVYELTFNGTLGSYKVSNEAIRTFFASTANGSLLSRNFTISNGTTTTTSNTTTTQSATASDGTAYIEGQGTQVKADLSTTYVASGGGAVIALEDDSLSVQTAEGQATINASSDDISSTPATTSTPSTTVTSSGNSITFVGEGWGHGIGMSQYGAKGMAEAGYSYQEILKHFYTGVEIK